MDFYKFAEILNEDANKKCEECGAPMSKKIDIHHNKSLVCLKCGHERKIKTEQVLNEISPELLDRAARKAYAQGDNHRHYVFKKAALDRKHPGEEGWEERFRILYRKLIGVSEETKNLMHDKDINADQKQRCREFYFELNDLLRTATRFFFK